MSPAKKPKAEAKPKDAEAPPAAKRWRNPKLTVDAVVPIEGGVLLVRRGGPPFEGKWALPGGFVNYNEDPERGVLRELEEEAGIKGRVTHLVGVYGDPQRDPRGHTVGVAYEVEVVFGEPSAGDDAAAVDVFPLDHLPELAFDHARILADWRAGRKRPLG